MSSYQTMSREDLLQRLLDTERAYDHAQGEVNRLVDELGEIADDVRGECQYSYAPGVVDSLLVRLGYRKHWEERKK